MQEGTHRSRSSAGRFTEEKANARRPAKLDVVPGPGLPGRVTGMCWEALHWLHLFPNGYRWKSSFLRPPSRSLQSGRTPHGARHYTNVEVGPPSEVVRGRRMSKGDVGILLGDSSTQTRPWLWKTVTESVRLLTGRHRQRVSDSGATLAACLPEFSALGVTAMCAGGVEMRGTRPVVCILPGA